MYVRYIFMELRFYWSLNYVPRCKFCVRSLVKMVPRSTIAVM